MPIEVDQLLLRELKDVLGSGEVLDLPAGSGHLSRQLEAAGFSVTAADLFPEDVQTSTGPVVGANMNEPLPFDGDRFDAIVCQEGIEHLENPAAFLRECGRILREGGHLWITTPNFMDLSGRLAYFLTGMKSFQAGFPEEETTLWWRQEERLYHGHAFTLPFFQIRYLLRVHGFEEIVLKGSGRSTLSRFLYPLVRPLSGFLIRRAFRRRTTRRPHPGRKLGTSPELVSDLLRAASSRDLLCSKKICVRARRGRSTVSRDSQ